MSTVKERACEYYRNAPNDFSLSDLTDAYVEIATEQQKIDCEIATEFIEDNISNYVVFPDTDKLGCIKVGQLVHDLVGAINGGVVPQAQSIFQACKDAEDSAIERAREWVAQTYGTDKLNEFDKYMK